MGKIIVLSSGGVDSVALGYALARDNPDTEILPIYMRTKLSPSYWIREEGSNERVFAMTNGNGTVRYPNMAPPTAIQHPEVRISRARTDRRNQIILTHMTRRIHEGEFGDDVLGFAMGVVPSDSDDMTDWVHGWTTHFGQGDHSPEFLQDYLHTLDPNLRLWTFGDYGADMQMRNRRVELFVDAISEEALWETTSCQTWWKRGDGRCHSCLDRHVAIMVALGHDETPYMYPPISSRWYPQYVVSMRYMDGFLEALKYNKDSRYWSGLQVDRELFDWMERQLNGKSEQPILGV